MIRALIALLFVCLVAGSLILSPDFHLILPSSERIVLVLVCYGLIGIPGLFFLATTRAVQWWQITLAALIVGAIALLVSGRYGPIYGPSYALWLLLRSVAASSFFWLAGVWRNPRFPDVASRLPTMSLAILAPVLAASAVGFVWLAPAKIYGHVIESSALDLHGNRVVSVKLLDGSSINASMMYAGARAPDSRSCVEMNTRRAFALPEGRRYWVENSYRCDSQARPDTRVSLR